MVGLITRVFPVLRGGHLGYSGGSSSVDIPWVFLLSTCSAVSSRHSHIEQWGNALSCTARNAEDVPGMPGGDGIGDVCGQAWASVHKTPPGHEKPGVSGLSNRFPMCARGCCGG